ncbi:predicted protein [Coccidioides posadasii str. Silveira]|uniref:Predicted protein n=1 Tax=Coccidioides posadasii (strain RMSCC 757 / Silveira) TaxID=443226 RepID=E9CTU8_COCPS|nr:predicted protein [Coccidioides posadasii str. Silveira]
MAQPLRGQVQETLLWVSKGNLLFLTARYSHKILCSTAYDSPLNQKIEEPER